MSDDKILFEFDREFQINILNIIFNDFDFLVLCNDIVKPEYFSDNILMWFYKCMRDYYLDYQVKINENSLKNEILKAFKNNKLKEQDIEAVAEVRKRLSSKIINKSYITDEVVNFCKHQAITQAVLNAPELLTKGDFSTIQQNFSDAFLIDKAQLDMGHWFFKDYKERIRERSEERAHSILPVGIPELDLLLGGGLNQTQYGLWMAPSNRGKSVALTHCGKRAIIQGKKVVYYSLEMSEKDQADRYDANMCRYAMQELAAFSDEIANKMRKFNGVYEDSLLIKTFTNDTTIDTIKSHLQRLFSVGWVPDLILIDYLELLTPTRFFKERREETSLISKQLSQMALNLKIPIWSATQSNRQAVSLETHTDEHIAEDYGKIRPADIGITLNQTKEEALDNIMRLFVMKNRNGPRYREVKIQNDFSRMCFYVAR